MDKFMYSIIFQFFKKVPPKKVTTLDTGSRGPLRGFYICHESKKFFTSCFSDGKIYVYEFFGDLKNEFTPTKIATLAGALNPRNLVYIVQLKKIVVAYESGLVAIYDMEMTNSPICNLIRFKKNS